MQLFSILELPCWPPSLLLWLLTLPGMWGSSCNLLSMCPCNRCWLSALRFLAEPGSVARSSGKWIMALPWTLASHCHFPMIPVLALALPAHPIPRCCSPPHPIC